MIVSLFKLLARLPLSVLQVLGGALGWLVYAGSGAYRRALRGNLAQAGIDDRAILRAAIAAAGQQSLETAWIWLRPGQALERKVQWADEAVLRAALAEQRPVVMLTPHLGSFEAIAQAYALRPEAGTRPMTALYRVPRKDVLRPLVEDARGQRGVLLAPADMRGVRMLMRAIRNRHVVGILPDQVPAEGEGVWAPFFGRPAYTMTLPAKLARAGDAIVLVFGAERLSRGRGFRIHIERMDAALTGDAVADATTLNHAIEHMVRRFPAQYLWGYNRYKKPAGVAAPAASDAGADASQAPR